MHRLVEEMSILSLVQYCTSSDEWETERSARSSRLSMRVIVVVDLTASCSSQCGEIVFYQNIWSVQQ